MFADLIAWGIFSVIVIFCIVMLYLQRGLHPEIFELIENEEILKHSKGDYWSEEEIGEVQNNGEFALTNKRLLFKGTMWLSQGKNVSIPYEEIESIRKVDIAKVLPVGFLITTKEKEEYKFSIMKRDIYMDFIQESNKSIRLDK